MKYAELELENVAADVDSALPAQGHLHTIEYLPSIEALRLCFILAIPYACPRRLLPATHVTTMHVVSSRESKDSVISKAIMIV